MNNMFKVKDVADLLQGNPLIEVVFDSYDIEKTGYCPCELAHGS